MKKILGIAITLVVILGLVYVFNGSFNRGNSVVIYVSHDRVFSEPILRDFERETGIRVYAVYDTEETKSTGVVNRLLAESLLPQADVYWANEPVRAEVLRQKGVLSPYVSPNSRGIPDTYKDPQGNWTGFAARARVFIVHKLAKNKPNSIAAYANPKWKDKAVIANPLFGTTTTQFAALSIAWGNAPMAKFLDAMKKNGVKISSSNGETADLVALGEFEFGLVDSDDAVSSLRKNSPVEIIYPDQGPGGLGCLIVPNAVALIRGSPNTENGKKLIDYLLSEETEHKLAVSDAAQIPLHPDVAVPSDVTPLKRLRYMNVRYAEVAARMLEIQPQLKTWSGY